MKKNSLILFLILLCQLGYSQGITAYIDFRQNFVVFDNGNFKTLEIQPIQNFKVGGKCIPYIDNLGYFKIYNNQQVYEVAYGTNIDYTVTDNLVTFFFNDQLWVFENGEKKLLSVWVTEFGVSDYTVAYLDNNDNSFSIYQAGEIIKLEDVTTGINDLDFKVGENIVAYNFLNSFKVYYLGKSTEISFNSTPTNYQVGRNIVAYSDFREQTFNVFFKGEIFKLEDFLPTWYKVGDNMVLYKDQLNNLKVFYLGEVIVLSTIDVTSMDIADNICYFIEQGQFKVFFDGKITVLEYFIPKSKILEQNTVLYLDQTNSLKYFDGTSGKIITSERVANFDININIISYQNSATRNRVYFKGKLY